MAAACIFGVPLKISFPRALCVIISFSLTLPPGSKNKVSFILINFILHYLINVFVVPMVIDEVFGSELTVIKNQESFFNIILTYQYY